MILRLSALRFTRACHGPTSNRIRAALGRNVILFYLYIALLTSVSFAQGGSVSLQIIQPPPPAGTGGPAPYATVRVCPYTASGTPCSPLSNLFLDPGLTVPTSNPATSDQYGNVSLWVSPGAVIVQVTPVNGILYSYLEQAVAGTVTSVGLTMPNIFNVSNSPVSGSGSIAVTFASESPNLILASPNGSTGTPLFRSLVAADVPTTLGPTSFTGNVGVAGTLSVTGTSTLTGNTSVGGTFGVTGVTTLNSTLGVTGATTLNNTLSVAGATTLSSTLGVSSTANIGGSLSVSGPTALNTLGVTNSSTLNGLSAITTTVRSLNGIQYPNQFPGSTADIQIAAAEAALPSIGGTIDARGYGCTTVTIANPINIGSVSQQITFIVDRCTNWNITVNTGTPAVSLYSSSSIWADSDSANPITSSGPGGFNLAAGANVASVLACVPGVAPEPICGIHGITLQGNSAATVTNGILDINNVTDQTTISDIVIYDFYNTVGLNIRTSSTDALGPLNFQNITINAYGNTGARPVKITSSGPGALTNINFFGGSLSHPGPGGIAIVDIEGPSASALINGVNFYGTQFESINTGDIGVGCVNCSGVHIVDATFTSDTNAGAACVKISNSGGSTTMVTIDNLINFDAWTNSIQNTVNSQNLTDARIAHYTYTDATTGTNQGRTYLPNINQTSAGQFAGTSACISSTKNIAFSIPYNATPVIVVFDETTGGGATLSSKANTGFTVACSGASDAFDWIAIGNPR